MPDANAVRLDIDRLPTSGRVFVARENELTRLDDAWDDACVHAITIVAWGGVGKSALVDRWLTSLAARDCGLLSKEGADAPERTGRPRTQENAPNPLGARASRPLSVPKERSLDALLERTRLHLAFDENAEARVHLDAASGLVERCGYGRRRSDVELLVGVLRERPIEVLGAQASRLLLREAHSEERATPESRRDACAPSVSPLETLNEKLAFLYEEAALADGVDQKFAIKKKIETLRQQMDEIKVNVES